MKKFRFLSFFVFCGIVAFNLNAMVPKDEGDAAVQAAKRRKLEQKEGKREEQSKFVDFKELQAQLIPFVFDFKGIKDDVERIADIEQSSKIKKIKELRGAIYSSKDVDLKNEALAASHIHEIASVEADSKRFTSCEFFVSIISREFFELKVLVDALRDELEEKQATCEKAYQAALQGYQEEKVTDFLEKKQVAVRTEIEYERLKSFLSLISACLKCSLQEKKQCLETFDEIKRLVDSPEKGDEEKTFGMLEKLGEQEELVRFCACVATYLSVFATAVHAGINNGVVEKLNAYLLSEWKNSKNIFANEVIDFVIYILTSIELSLKGFFTEKYQKEEFHFNSEVSPEHYFELQTLKAMLLGLYQGIFYYLKTQIYHELNHTLGHPLELRLKRLTRPYLSDMYDKLKFFADHFFYSGWDVMREKAFNDFFVKALYAESSARVKLKEDKNLEALFADRIIPQKTPNQGKTKLCGIYSLWSVACAENKLLLNEDALHEFKEDSYTDEFSLPGQTKTEVELKWIVYNYLKNDIMNQNPSLRDKKDAVLKFAKQVSLGFYEEPLKDYFEEAKALVGSEEGARELLTQVSRSPWYNTTVIYFADIMSFKPLAFRNLITRLKGSKTPQWLILCNQYHYVSVKLWYDNDNLMMHVFNSGDGAGGEAVLAEPYKSMYYVLYALIQEELNKKS